MTTRRHMHSTVRVRDVDSETSKVYTLVFPVEADIEQERVPFQAEAAGVGSLR